MDYMIRAMDKKQTFRLFMARSTNTVEEARQHHNTTPGISCSGSVPTAVMMGYMMKNEKDRLTININGRSHRYDLIVSDNSGHVDMWAIKR